MGLSLASHLPLSLLGNDDLPLLVLGCEQVEVDYILCIKNHVLFSDVKLFKKLKIKQGQLEPGHWVGRPGFEYLDYKHLSVQNSKVPLLIFIKNF